MMEEFLEAYFSDSDLRYEYSSNLTITVPYHSVQYIVRLRTSTPYSVLQVRTSTDCVRTVQVPYVQYLYIIVAIQYL